MRRLFFCLVVLGSITVCTTVVDASPMVATIGSARVTLTLSPDPPQVGNVHAMVTVDGASAAALQNTAVAFSSQMPTMSMTGPSGELHRESPNHWSFHTTLAMATTWHLVLRFTGGLQGDVPFDFAIAGSPGTNAMESMSSSGNADAWRTATFALVALVIIGGLVLYRDRRPVTIAAVAAVALVVVGLAALQARFATPAMDMASMQSVGGAAPAPVTLVTISGSNRGGSTIAAPANVVPFLTQNIVARAPGLLTDLSVYTGDHISAGQVVAHLDEPELRSDAAAAAAEAEAAHIEAMHHAPNGLVIAENDVAVARADLVSKERARSYWDNEMRRERELLAQGAVSQREYEDEVAQGAAATAAYNAAQATLRSAQTRVGDAGASVEMAEAQARGAAATAQSRAVMAAYTTVVIPDDSIVTKRLVDPGVYVESGTPILQVAVVDRLRVQAQVAQRDLPDIRIGTPLDVTFDGGRRTRGSVTSISPVVDPQTHTAIVEAVVSNPGDVYQPGAFAHATLYVGRRVSGAVTVPSAAIVGGASAAVWVEDRGMAHRVDVTVASDDGSSASVTGALRDGMRVVVAGASSLEEGQPIREARP